MISLKDGDRIALYKWQHTKEKSYFCMNSLILSDNFKKFNYS